MLTPAEQELLQSFNLSRRQKREVWDAYLENPAGLIGCAARARHFGLERANNGAGLLLTMIRRGDHRDKPESAGRRVTGWRFQRGTHSGCYVSDPLGTDPLPAGHA